MDSRDPEPGGAPEGEPADGRLPAPPTPAAAPARVTGWAAWRAWRGRRPFLGGVLMTLGGAEILLTERASLGVVVHIGMQGLTGYLIPAVLVVCGLLTIFNPAQRLFYSVLGVLLALGSWITSNLGGFLIGLLMGVVGSCLAFGWLPDQEPRVGVVRRMRNRGARRKAAAGGTGLEGDPAHS